MLTVRVYPGVGCAMALKTVLMEVMKRPMVYLYVVSILRGLTSHYKTRVM